MKIIKILIALSAFFYASFTVEKAHALQKHVEGTITLGPCQISYNGDITYSLFPPNISGFHGTVTFGGGCHGTITCMIVPHHNADGTIVDLTYAYAGGDMEAYHMIQQPDYKQALIATFNTIEDTELQE